MVCTLNIRNSGKLFPRFLQASIALSVVAAWPLAGNAQDENPAPGTSPTPPQNATQAPLPPAVSLPAPAPVFQGGALSVEEAVRLATVQDIPVALRNAAVAAARAEVREDLRLDSPELRIGQTNDQGPASQRQSIDVRISPPNPWEAKAIEEEAEAAAAVVEQQLAGNDAFVAYETKLLYFQARYRQDDLALARRLVTIADEKSAAYERLVKQGRITKPEALGARFDAIVAHTEVDEAQVELNRAFADLAAWAGMDNPQGVVLSSPLAPVQLPATALDLDTLLAVALANRPELNTLGYEKALVNARIKRDRIRSLPWISYIQGGFEHGRHDNGPDEVSFSMGIEIPIWEWLDRKKKNAAPSAELAEREMEIQLESGEIRKQINTALIQIRTIQSQWQQMEARYAGLQEEMNTALEAARKTSLLEPNRIAKMEEGVVRIDRMRLEIRYRFQMALSSLEAAVGTDI